MGQWHKKRLGEGAAVYQNLRELSYLRYQHDPDVSAERMYIVAVDTVAAEMSAYFPSGNQVLVAACNAMPCPPPNFDGQFLRKLSEERFPIPRYATDFPEADQ